MLGNIIQKERNKIVLGVLDKLTIDPVHRETFVPVIGAIMVFPSDANGNVPPIRILKGPETQLSERGPLPSVVSVDPVHNLLVVPERAEGGGGRFLIFNRTDSGNVKPRAIITTPKDLAPTIGETVVDPETGLIFSIVTDIIGGVGQEFLQYTEHSYIGVWSIFDSGEVPPRWMIGGPPNGTMRDPKGLEIDAKHKNVFIADRYTNTLLTYYVPEIF